MRNIPFRALFFAFFFVQFLSLTPAFANCLERLPGVHRHAAEPPQAYLAALLQRAAIDCQGDSSEYFYQELAQFFQSDGRAVRADGGDRRYDVIIVGGGISGAAAAIAIGGGYRVLVLDKNTERTSVFGSTAGYKLFSVPVFNFEGSPVSIRDVSTPRDKRPTIIARNVAIDLFFSRADVLLGFPVSSIVGESADPAALAYTVESNGQRFTAKTVIVATGLQGVNLASFDAPTQEFISHELSRPDGRIRAAENVFEALHRGEPTIESMFGNKHVAIIGGSKSGEAVARLLGESRRPLKSVVWYISARSPELPPGKFFINHEKVETITSNEKGRLEIRTKGGDEVIVVDDVILATGYASGVDRIIPQPEIRDRLVRETNAFSRYVHHQGARPNVSIIAIGAAEIQAIGSPARPITFHASFAGRDAGKLIREDLQAGPPPALPSADADRAKIEKRITFLLDGAARPPRP